MSENKSAKFVNQYFTEPLKAAHEWIKDRTIAKMIILAIVSNYIIESFSRKSPLQGLWHLVSNPVVFFYNSLLIFFTLLFSLFFPKRKAACIIIDILWLSLGIINGILLTYRITPLSAVDFTLIMSVKTIFAAYITIFQGVLIVIGIIALLVIMIMLVIKSKSTKIEWVKGLVTFFVTGTLVVIFGLINTASGTLSDDFVKLPDAYSNYGFVYSFLVGTFDRGISKPKNYSEEEIGNILNIIEDNNGNAVPKVGDTNILMLQLESFMDVSHLKKLTFSENPIPIFSQLKENYPHGFLQVPSIGAGTANTEFEVITGMNIDYFGAGEYPYKTILQTNTCETVCYDLKELGYTCHAIHNNDGTFYERDEVFSNLGFDTFTPIEYMYDLTYNPTGWVRDSELTKYIIGAMDSTDTKDFVYTISVQGHGKYPTAQMDNFTPSITVDGIEDEKTRYGFEYYVNQIHEMDMFIDELISELEDYGEPVVLVLYGDHLPNFTIEETEIDNGNLFQTEYVIWSNFDLDVENRDLESYQLASYIFDTLGITNGTITKLHQECSDMVNYQEMLEMLEYDMLYGDKSTFGGENPYEPTDLKMGIKNISVNRVRIIEDDAYIFGDMFNECSIVCVDGERTETSYLDKNVLRISGDELKNGCSVTVIQAGSDRKELSSTEPFTYIEGTINNSIPEKIYGIDD